MDMFLLAVNEKAATKMRYCHSQIPSAIHDLIGALLLLALFGILRR